MSDQLAEALLRYTNTHPGESPFMTPIDGVAILRSDRPKPPTPMISKPALCIVAQGAKWATFGGNKLVYQAGQALLIGVEAPSIGRVVAASPDAPCLVLAIELDLAVMRSVADEMAEPPPRAETTSAGIFVTDFDGPLADCALRLVRLIDTPQAIPVLRPLILREICYWLLTGAQGADVAALTLKNGPSQRIIDAINWLRSRFRQTIRIEELAEMAQMSPSAFHRHFKALTSMTPLQYQKQLRLLEARRLMISYAASVETASFEVGYESASQFSREYARMFGTSPRRDVTAMHRALRVDELETARASADGVH
ncbi:AraC family transcriptional regulator [Pandoraea sp.]|uniref:AraC family transcriptional regulator n=1 Tax=Pandoraea sp. TaxID=1883445 RepID=UPI00122557F7|nr:AraC family transcriptional regulator [Pandoraea sp.]TAL52841.1 MAG: AraC family transcriptional regulator [Pandoraea sp.]TAM19714.1 MAG: AraC family transcriptional regulator [Pandoraea sp.]